ncbi:putative late blight resistance protein homolog R1A-10 [Sesamum indicum]|uniref:Late blight resistance protein homolog R1A-10 n=1 Tax=Sesamum indicum TaxID=4182 RepID=A0A6I9SNZ8_SESIN|nr:putative late blight resistance protein homolog R1A-10 [Sesamum indicum]
MAAYGAVVSLQQILNTILDQPEDGGPIFLNKFQLQSLREKVSFLLDFLEHSSSHKTNNQPAQESLEKKIRDVVYAAEDVIESKIREKAYPVEDQSPIQDSANVFDDFTESPASSKLTPEPESNRSFWDQDPISPAFFFVHLLIFILVGRLIPGAIQKLMVILIQLILSVTYVRPFTLRALAPVCFQNVILVVVQVLIPFIVQICLPMYILNLVSVLVPALVHVAVLKGVFFAARYVQLREVLVPAWFSRIQQVLSVKHKLDDRTGQVSSSARDDSEQEDQGRVSMSAKIDSVQKDQGQVSLSVKDDQEDKELLRLMEDVISITREVIKVKDTFGAGEGLWHSNVLPGASLSRRDSGGVRKNVVVGFDKDLEQIKTQWIDDSSKLEIISIVGMGGIGKTTLARQVYDDPSIFYHFDTRGWVAVSQEYSLRQVLLGLLDSTKMLTEEMQDESDARLAEFLYKCLKGRRYLIVMDDIWDIDIWDAVSRLFPDDSNGSRVLLTTRLSDVAVYANSSSRLHQMRFLNVDDSWNLLCKKVFGEKDCPPELEDVGREIARNCGGLPLAIVVIGGLLYKESRTWRNWRSIAENLNSVFSKDDEQCLEILGLSYNRLPHRLKPCFLYMGVFPEDSEIPVSKLINLWAAEGFLKPSTSKTLEEVAEEYLKDLIERSLILACKRSCNGRIKTCNIHDLLRDVCVRNAQKENFLDVVNWDGDLTEEGNRSRRRLSIHPDALYANTTHHSTSSYSLARSFLCTGKSLTYPSLVYLGFRFLRVLDIIVIHFSEFPSDIIRLFHLRYLGFTYKGPLPPSISKLRNLQTVVHHNWTFGKYPLLPIEIWTMPNLRHLYFMPSCLPDPLGGQVLANNFVVLENLQALLDIRNFRCSKDILKRIPNLKKLGISYDVSSQAYVDWSQFELESLVNLHQLETLKIVIKNDPYRTSKFVNPPQLAFPQKLKRLTLSGCGLPWETMTIVGSLPNLEVLKLKKDACRGQEWEPVEEQFCRLKYLLLEELDLVQWRTNEAHFPCLQSLIIRSCFRLREIPSAIGDITTLQMIELVDCHPSAVTSAKQIQEEQESMANEDLKVCIELKRRFKDRFSSRILR